MTAIVCTHNHSNNLLFNRYYKEYYKILSKESCSSPVKVSMSKTPNPSIVWYLCSATFFFFFARKRSHLVCLCPVQCHFKKKKKIFLSICLLLSVSQNPFNLPCHLYLHPPLPHSHHSPDVASATLLYIVLSPHGFKATEHL